MVDSEDMGECSSQFSEKSMCINDVAKCEKCSEYESKLKEARDVLNSMRIINELLQKELLTYATSTSTWGIEPDPNGNEIQPFENRPTKHTTNKSYSEVATTSGKRKPVVHSSIKKKKTPTVPATATEQSYISPNRFTPLTNHNVNQTDEINSRSNYERSSTKNPKKNFTPSNVGNKIPTIINGRAMNVESHTGTVPNDGSNLPLAAARVAAVLNTNNSHSTHVLTSNVCVQYTSSLG